VDPIAPQTPALVSVTLQGPMLQMWQQVPLDPKGHFFKSTTRWKAVSAPSLMALFIIFALAEQLVCMLAAICGFFSSLLSCPFTSFLPLKYSPL
jgi:hypothetical protein